MNDNLPLLLTLYKITLVSGEVSLIGWIVLYSILAPWWRNPIGRTLVAKTALIALIIVPSILGLFFHLTIAAHNYVAWIDIGLVGLITPVMIWRSAVWLKIYRFHKNGKDKDYKDAHEGGM